VESKRKVVVGVPQNKKIKKDGWDMQQEKSYTQTKFPVPTKHALSVKQEKGSMLSLPLFERSVRDVQVLDRRLKRFRVGIVELRV